jgi:hypothetical protein
VPDLVRVILAEVVSELIAAGELLLANGAPERSLHHILRLKGQWPTIGDFFYFSQINVCFVLSTSMRLSVPASQKARMLALIGGLPNIALEEVVGVI